MAANLSSTTTPQPLAVPPVAPTPAVAVTVPVTVKRYETHYEINLPKSSAAAAPMPMTARVTENLTSPVFKSPRSTHCLAKLVYKIKDLWDLIKRLFNFLRKWLPQYDEANVYAHFLLEGTQRAIPDVLTSRICHGFCEFLSKEKKVPKELIATIKETADWMDGVERAIAMSGKKKDLHLSKIAQAISKRIQSLRDGEFCVVPGGIAGLFAIYKITKVGATYTLEFLSRDPKLPHGEKIAFLGKEKICIGTTFEKISGSEISDPVRLQGLLDVQTRKSTVEHLELLLGPFKEKIVNHPEKRKFAKMHQDGRVGVLWSLVQESLYKGRKSQGKLRRQIFALYRYAEELSTFKKIPSSARELALDASKRIGQKILVMVDKKELSEEEAKELYGQIKRVGELVSDKRRLDIASSKVAYTPVGSFTTPSLDPASPSENIMEISESADELKSKFENEPKRADEVEQKHKTEALRESGKVLKETFPLFTRESNPSEFLTNLRIEFDRIAKGKDPVAMQFQLIELCKTFASSLNENEFWAQRTAEERITASKLCTDLATLLVEKATETEMFYPNRYVAIIKCFLLTQHLAMDLSKNKLK